MGGFSAFTPIDGDWFKLVVAKMFVPVLVFVTLLHALLSSVFHGTISFSHVPLLCLSTSHWIQVVSQFITVYLDQVDFKFASNLCRLFHFWCSTYILMVGQWSTDSNNCRYCPVMTDQTFTVAHFQWREIAEFVQVSTHYCLCLPELLLQCYHTSLYVVPQHANSAISVFDLPVTAIFRYVNLASSVSGAKSMAFFDWLDHSCHCRGFRLYWASFYSVRSSFLEDASTWAKFLKH